MEEDQHLGRPCPLIPHLLLISILKDSEIDKKLAHKSPCQCTSFWFYYVVLTQRIWFSQISQLRSINSQAVWSFLSWKYLQEKLKWVIFWFPSTNVSKQYTTLVNCLLQFLIQGPSLADTVTLTYKQWLSCSNAKWGCFTSRIITAVNYLHSVIGVPSNTSFRQVLTPRNLQLIWTDIIKEWPKGNKSRSEANLCSSPLLSAGHASRSCCCRIYFPAVSLGSWGSAALPRPLGLILPVLAELPAHPPLRGCPLVSERMWHPAVLCQLR